MKKIGVVANLHKQEAAEITRKLVNLIESRQGKPMLYSETALLLQRPDLGYSEYDLWNKADLLFVLGGDGTLLNTAKSVLVSGIPILGINLGRLGFLSEVEIDSLELSVQEIFADNFYIEERSMLEAYTTNNHHAKYIGLNDIVISRGALSRVISYDIAINNRYVDSYLADGIIIATPTGSTAYSLSAGGPIVSPYIPGIILTPICPHSLYSRSMIVSDCDLIEITMSGRYEDAYLTVDGQRGAPIAVDEKIIIYKSSMVTKLVRFKQHDFYSTLHKRLIEPMTNRDSQKASRR